MPTKLKLTILGRIAYFINGLKSVNRCFIVVIINFSESVKIRSPAARVFLRFPKISQHPACMDHAILHGKPFSNPLLIRGRLYKKVIKVNYD